MKFYIVFVTGLGSIGVLKVDSHSWVDVGFVSLHGTMLMGLESDVRRSRVIAWPGYFCPCGVRNVIYPTRGLTVADVSNVAYHLSETNRLGI
jgi:hypothetical protein